MNDRYDYIIVGAGLQGGLLRLALGHYQPAASVLLVDQGASIGGNHTWSFHAGDIPAAIGAWLDPVVTSWWPGYEVRFPNFHRQLHLPYASIDSRRFGATVQQLFHGDDREDRLAVAVAGRGSGAEPTGGAGSAESRPDRRWAAKPGELRRSLRRPTSQLLLETAVDRLTATAISIGDREIHGDVVVDCRGPARAMQQGSSSAGFQKFYGFEVELAEPWPLALPTVMDSCLSQADGFRFVYSLPLTRRRVLVEHTQFSADPRCDRTFCLDSVREYMARITPSRWQLIREESGCLPMPWDHAQLPSAETPLRGGYAGGWFHAATGYSLPLAARWADVVAQTPAAGVATAIGRLAEEHRGRAQQARFLNRLLFRLVPPPRRYEIFRRFYRVLSEPAIARFYAHQFSGRDLTRILIGCPPSRLTPVSFLKSFVRAR